MADKDTRPKILRSSANVYFHIIQRNHLFEFHFDVIAWGSPEIADLLDSLVFL